MSEPGTSRWRGLALLASCVLVGLGVIVVRLAIDARAAIQAGEEARQAGKTDEAIRRYGEAARMHFPGNPFVTQALDRLNEIALGADKGGNAATARRAFEEARGAILAGRSFFVPHGERLPAIDHRLARIYAAIEDPKVDPGASVEARVAWHAERLSRRPGPAPVQVAMALGGLALWLGAAVGFFLRGLDEDLRLRPGQAIASGALFLVGIALFLTGLRLA